MKKRNRILLTGLVAVAVAGAITWLAFPEPPEPVYQGKKLSIWLHPYQAGGMVEDPVDRQIWSDSDEAVRAIGTNAIPFLLQRLRATDSFFSRRLLQLAAKQRFIKIRLTPAWEFRCEAVIAFRVLGASASNAIPEMVDICNHTRSHEVMTHTMEALGNIGPPAVPAVTQFLTNKNRDIRSEATNALGRIAWDTARRAEVH